MPLGGESEQQSQEDDDEEEQKEEDESSAQSSPSQQSAPEATKKKKPQIALPPLPDSWIRERFGLEMPARSASGLRHGEHDNAATIAASIIDEISINIKRVVQLQFNLEMLGNIYADKYTSAAVKKYTIDYKNAALFTETLGEIHDVFDLYVLPIEINKDCTHEEWENNNDWIEATIAAIKHRIAKMEEFKGKVQTYIAAVKQAKDFELARMLQKEADRAALVARAAQERADREFAKARGTDTPESPRQKRVHQMKCPKCRVVNEVDLDGDVIYADGATCVVCFEPRANIFYKKCKHICICKECLQSEIDVLNGIPLDKGTPAQQGGSSSEDESDEDSDGSGRGDADDLEIIYGVPPPATENYNDPDDDDPLASYAGSDLEVLPPRPPLLNYEDDDNISIQNSRVIFMIPQPGYVLSEAPWKIHDIYRRAYSCYKRVVACCATNTFINNNKVYCVIIRVSRSACWYVRRYDIGTYTAIYNSHEAGDRALNAIVNLTTGARIVNINGGDAEYHTPCTSTACVVCRFDPNSTVLYPSDADVYPSDDDSDEDTDEDAMPRLGANRENDEEAKSPEVRTVRGSPAYYDMDLHSQPQNDLERRLLKEAQRVALFARATVNGTSHYIIIQACDPLEGEWYVYIDQYSHNANAIVRYIDEHLANEAERDNLASSITNGRVLCHRYSNYCLQRFVQSDSEEDESDDDSEEDESDDEEEKGEKKDAPVPRKAEPPARQLSSSSSDEDSDDDDAHRYKRSARRLAKTAITVEEGGVELARGKLIHYNGDIDQIEAIEHAECRRALRSMDFLIRRIAAEAMNQPKYATRRVRVTINVPGTLWHARRYTQSGVLELRAYSLPLSSHTSAASERFTRLYDCISTIVL
jgi:hypothetical protein